MTTRARLLALLSLSFVLALACTGPIPDGSSESSADSTDSLGDSYANQDACEAVCGTALACGEDLGEDCVSHCRETVTDPDAIEELACFAAEWHASLCDMDAAEESCLRWEDSENEYEPVSDTEDEEEEEPLGYLSLEALGCTVDGCGSDVTDTLGLLAEASAALGEAFPGGGTLYAGVSAGGNVDEGAIQVRSDSYFEGQDFETDPQGWYTVASFAVGSEFCSLLDFQLGVLQDGGGICGPIAIAHSLVHRLGVVDSEWDNVFEDTDGDGEEDSWDPDFLKAIVEAGGVEGDGHKGMTTQQISDAHTADWNEKWPVERSRNTGLKLGWKKMPKVPSNPGWFDDDCDDLKDWCETLSEASSDYGDDCILAMDNGSDAHVAPIMNATWHEDECYCEVRIVDTGKQDPKGDYTGVPKSPGYQTWTFGKKSDIAHTKGTSKNFWNALRFKNAQYTCYDENRRTLEKLGLKTYESKPGEAFPD